MKMKSYSRLLIPAIVLSPFLVGACGEAYDPTTTQTFVMSGEDFNQAEANMQVAEISGKKVYLDLGRISTSLTEKAIESTKLSVEQSEDKRLKDRNNFIGRWQYGLATPDCIVETVAVKSSIPLTKGTTEPKSVAFKSLIKTVMTCTTQASEKLVLYVQPHQPVILDDLRRHRDYRCSLEADVSLDVQALVNDTADAKVENTSDSYINPSTFTCTSN